MSRHVFLRSLVAAALAVPLAAAAQGYPNRVVKMVSSAGAGGMGDLSGRVVAAELEKRLGRPVIMENRAGANGTIGVKYIIAAAPDGYTLGWINGTTTHPLLIKNNAVDPLKELTLISVIVPTAFVVVTSKSLPLATVQEVIAYARANPDRFNYASVNNPPMDLYMATMSGRIGPLKYTPIPYKGGPDQQAAIAKGEAHIALASVLSAVSLLKTGKVNLLMVTNPRRSPLIPDVPTSEEAGIPGFEATSNSGLWAPLGTPRDVLQRLSTESMAIAKDPEFAQKITNSFGLPPLVTTPEEARRLIEREVQVLSDAARIMKFEPQ